MKRRFAALYAVALVPVVLLAGCGDDELQGTLPDTTPPLAPVLANVSGLEGTVYVSWVGNTEADLDGYYVYIGGDNQFSRVNPVPTKSHYMAIETRLGIVEIYVTAVDYSGNESSPSATRMVQAGTERPDDRIQEPFPPPKVF